MKRRIEIAERETKEYSISSNFEKRQRISVGKAKIAAEKIGERETGCVRGFIKEI